MSSTLVIVLIMSAVSALLTGLGSLVRCLTRVCGVLLLLWLAAALPLMFFLDVSSELVLLFYLISAVCGLIFTIGGRPA